MEKVKKLSEIAYLSLNRSLRFTLLSQSRNATAGHDTTATSTSAAAAAATVDIRKAIRVSASATSTTPANQHTSDERRDSTLKKQNSTDSASQELLTSNSSYGAAILNSLSNTTNLTYKLVKEYSKYYTYVTDTLKTTTTSTAKQPATRRRVELTRTIADGDNNKQPAAQPVNPISLKDTTKIPALIPKVTSNASNVNADVSPEARLLAVCDSLERASSSMRKSELVVELFKQLYAEPELRFVIYRKKKTLIPHLVTLRDERLNKRDDKRLVGWINQCLAILGHVDENALKHRGINVLSLDGGGARGFVTIEVLKNIERLCGKPIHQIFDYICGVSTGACVAALLTIYKLSLDEIERQYKIFVKEIFDRNKAAGISNLVMSYAYYDTSVWERMLKEAMGDTLVINSAKENDGCKLSLVSNITTANQMKIFLFRNYNLPTWAQSHYDGTCRYKVWEAVRASSAAPGYYEDFKLDGYVFHDGGILANNPTAIAIHEARQLWPSAPTNCIVSIGNGRYQGTAVESSKLDSISLKQKINRIVSGVSSTQTVHNMLLDLLPAKLYFRFNPYLSEEFYLDENRPNKWKLMQYETSMYMRRNMYKFETCAKQLLKDKSYLQMAQSFIKKSLSN